MRYVQRGAEPPELTEFKAAANADWTPRYRDFDKKSAVAMKIAREQGFLCGYCGSRVGERAFDCHIEHVDAQSVNPARELDYANMLASCQGSDTKPPVPEHCGAKRGNEPLPVTPFLPDCGAYFSYGSDGRIEPAPDVSRRSDAERTIRLLGLDVRRLTAARAAAIEGALDGLDGLSVDAWRAEAAAYDLRDPDGRLTPFCFALQQVLLRYA